MRYEAKWDRLKNGMLYVSQYGSGGGNNVAGVGVKVGSIHDPPGMSGMAHLVEHMRCRYSPKYNGRQVDLIIEKYLGGLDGKEINIGTEKVSTYYGFNNLLRRPHMMTCFDMMADLARNGILDQKGLKVEKAAVHQEYYLRGIDVPEGLVWDLTHEVMYRANLARKRVDCQPEELRKITLSNVNRFVQRYYVPRNMFVIMLGPKHEEVRATAEKCFGDWDDDSEPEFKYDNSEEIPTLKQVRSKEIYRPGLRQYHLAIGFPTESYMSPDAEALEALARLWAFRLKEKLREENEEFDKGAYRELCYTSRSFAHGLIYAWFATKSKEFFQEGERIVLAEARRLKEELVADDELDAMVSNLDFSYLDIFKNVAAGLQEEIIEAIANGDENLSRLHTFRDRLRRVTRRKIREIANKYFDDNYARVALIPA